MEVDDVILTSIFTKCEKFDVSTYSFSKIHLQNKHQEIFEYLNHWKKHLAKAQIILLSKTVTWQDYRK